MNIKKTLDKDGIVYYVPDRINNNSKTGNCRMNENQVRLAKITCECPKCDKLFTMERYVDGPVDIDSCRVVCFNCIRRRVGSYAVNQ